VSPQPRRGDGLQPDVSGPTVVGLAGSSLDSTGSGPESEVTITKGDSQGSDDSSFTLAEPEGLASDFGKYELLGEIGRGGMGVVYKARQTDLDRVVAIKMILSSHLASAEQVRRFYAEARAAARLQHPHIVRIHEVGRMYGQHFFAMEYVAGPSLAERLRQGPITPADAARLVAIVARAVAHLHSQGFVHRDLKPSNILLDGTGQPFVSDFGLVKMLEADGALTGTNTIVGTPSYMAPEQASGRSSKVGPHSDVYSLGAILYELLTGRTLFQGESPIDTLVQVLEREPERPSRINPRVPRMLELICLKCLEKSPEERYRSAAALAEDLERFLRGEDVEARRVNPLQRAEAWVRKEPALASRLGALAICTAILQIAYHSGGVGSAMVNLGTVAVLVSWVVVALVFQWLLRHGIWPEWVPMAWSASDVILLSALLGINHDLNSPLVVAYSLVVVGSGLWFRVRLVWVTTLLTELAYGALILDSILSRGAVPGKPYHHVLFLAILAVVGFVVAYLVQRVRMLSRYYEHRMQP
jgi:eukaryotic-like serine/threonine-protein kinase